MSRRPINPEALQRIRDFLEVGLDAEDEALLKDIEELTSDSDVEDTSSNKNKEGSAPQGDRSSEQKHRSEDKKSKKNDADLESDRSVGSHDFDSHAGSDSSASGFTCSERDSMVSSDDDYEGHHKKKKKKISRAEKEARREVRDDDRREKKAAHVRQGTVTVPDEQLEDGTIKKPKKRHLTEAELRAHNMLKRHAGPSAMAALSKEEAADLSQAARIHRAHQRAIESTAALKAMEQKYESMSQVDVKGFGPKGSKGRSGRGSVNNALGKTTFSSSHVSAVVTPILEDFSGSVLSQIQRRKERNSAGQFFNTFECIIDKLLLASNANVAPTTSPQASQGTSSTNGSNVVKDMLRRPAVKAFVSNELNSKVDIENRKRHLGQKQTYRDDDDEDEDEPWSAKRPEATTATSKLHLSLGFDSEELTFNSIAGDDLSLISLRASIGVSPMSHFVASMHNANLAERYIPLIQSFEANSVL